MIRQRIVLIAFLLCLSGCMSPSKRKSVHQEMLTVEQYGKALELRDFTLAEQSDMGRAIVALARSVLEDLGMEDSSDDQ